MIQDEKIKTNRNQIDEHCSSYDDDYYDEYYDDDYMPINNDGIKSCLGCMFTLIVIAALFVTVVVYILKYIYNICSQAF